MRSSPKKDPLSVSLGRRRKGTLTTTAGSAGGDAAAANRKANKLIFQALNCMIVLVVGVLFGSNLYLLRHWFSKSEDPFFVAGNGKNGKNNLLLRKQQKRQRQPRSASTSSSANPNCELRRYPPHRYYGLSAESTSKQPDFLTTNAEYVYGEWPIVLKRQQEKSGSGSGKTSKVCVDQSDWLPPSPKSAAAAGAAATLPFADGTNPSLLSLDRLLLEARHDASNLAQLRKAYPNARYLATACMTNTQCAWRDSPEELLQYRISNQTEPTVVLTVLLLLDGDFRSLAQTQLMLERDADWGENPRKRIKASASASASGEDTKYHRPQLDDARLFVHDDRVWLSYRQGVEFGYDVQVLNPLHYSFDDKVGNNGSGGKTSSSFRAWLKASETASFCCGRNMALMAAGGDSGQLLQSLTWVDPVTVVDVDTTPLLVKKQQAAGAVKQRRRLSLEEEGTETLVGEEEDADADESSTPTISIASTVREHHQPAPYGNETHAQYQIRRRLQGKKEKKRESHVHGTNAFMLYLPVPHDLFLGMAHFHRPHHRGSNKYARHGHHYTHAFFAVSAAPPFHLVSLSPEFVLPSVADPNDAEIIQFASGLELVANEDKLVIAYGINDCEAAITTVSFSYVMRQLLRPVEGGKEVVDYMEKLKQ